MSIELPDDFAVARLPRVKIVETFPTDQGTASCRHGIEVPVDGRRKRKIIQPEQVELPGTTTFENVVAILWRAAKNGSLSRQQERVINLGQAPISTNKVRLPRTQSSEPPPGITVGQQELLSANPELANCELTQVRTVSRHWQWQLESLPDAAQNPRLRGHKSTVQP